ncbi:MAG: hypothetical protein NZM43_13695 [Saprospiraceae bacterium]|nr:hypothetical protein [Saprospiraceae bacterium]MDW8485368.1 hypothetical protein [Saprospiraceae bacterium]
MNVPSTRITARLPLWVERALDAANEQASKEGLLRVPKGDLLYYLYLYHREFHPQVLDAFVQPCAELFRRDGC